MSLDSRLNGEVPAALTACFASSVLMSGICIKFGELFNALFYAGLIARDRELVLESNSITKGFDVRLIFAAHWGIGRFCIRTLWSGRNLIHCCHRPSARYRRDRRWRKLCRFAQ
jgi:hypothetical protein